MRTENQLATATLVTVGTEWEAIGMGMASTVMAQVSERSEDLDVGMG